MGVMTGFQIQRWGEQINHFIQAEILGDLKRYKALFIFQKLKALSGLLGAIMFCR